MATKLQQGSPQGSPKRPNQGSHQGPDQAGHLVYSSASRQGPELRASPGNAQDLADIPSTPFQAAPVRLAGHCTCSTMLRPDQGPGA